MGGLGEGGEQLLTHGVRPVINPCTSTLTPPFHAPGTKHAPDVVNYSAV